MSRPTSASNLLIFALAGLLVTGCEVFGDEDSSPEWTGNWRVTEDFTGDSPERETYLSYGENRLTTFKSDPVSGCNIFSNEVLEVNGSEVRFELGSGALLTERLTVSDGILTAEVIRANFQGLEGRSRKATSVKENPRDLLECGGSEASVGTPQTWYPTLKQDH